MSENITALTVVDGPALYYAFSSGAREVIETQDYLNKINVFPVKDGDTGTNLASTMRSMLELASVHDSIGKTAMSIADAALLGARGNSGIIFAQFIHGLSSAIRDKQTIDTKNFTEAVSTAVDCAYKAVSSPMEGTMLTVMREWARALSMARDTCTDFLKLLDYSNGIAERALENTPEQLRILKENGVVDAGAKGFVAFLKGMKKSVSKEDPGDLRETVNAVEIGDQNAPGNENIEFRYCTELLMEELKVSTGELTKAATKFGDSVVIAGSSEKVKLHVHTNKPEELVQAMKNKGTIIHQKVDDVELQYRMSRKRLAPIALITDSTCDLPDEVMDHYQISMVPLNLISDNCSYVDRITIKPAQFYELLNKKGEYPVSSQPSVKTFQNLYTFLTSHYDSIIAIHVSSNLSGTWNASKLAAGQFEGKKITVIDSKQVSGSLGLIVLKAARLIEAGKEHEEIVTSVNKMIEKSRIFVSVNNLKYMVRGGRVPPMKGFVANAINLKPIVSLDNNGHSKLYGKAFSRKSNLKKIMGFAEELDKKYNVVMYNIGHANAPYMARKLGAELTVLLNKEPEYVMEISPVLSISAGEGAISLSLLCESDTWN